MKIGLQPLVSPTHNPEVIEQTLRPFISALSQALEPHQVVTISPQERNSVDIPLIFVQSGGVEGIFKNYYQKIEEPYLFLATDKHNSLAASMEMLSFLQQHNKRGQILHGSIDSIATTIMSLAKVFNAKKRLQGYRVGVIGQPSDWLIASDVKATAIKERLGVEIVEIELSELLKTIQAVPDEQIIAPHQEILYQKDFPAATLKESYRIYTGLKRLAHHYQLQAFTLRCFDLLEPLQNTGCLALSLCNEEGLLAGCEGDVPALLSMVILNLLTEEAVFMANPSRIDTTTNEVVFAHCTLPWQMARQHTLKSHFESGLGTAIQGTIPEGGATIFKTNNDCSEYFVTDALIQSNLKEETLCRTQIKVKMQKDAQTFLTHPLGNHQLICLGQHQPLIELFFNWL